MRLPHAIILRDTVVLRCTAADVFIFLTQGMPTVYPALAWGHERFEIEGSGPMRVGSEIDCRERAGNQEVHHRYVVQELVESQLVRYASRPSTTFVHLRNRSITGHSDTVVTYALEPTATGQTRLEMTIEIVFASLWKWMIACTLGRASALWKSHQREELGKLVAIVEADALRRAAFIPVSALP